MGGGVNSPPTGSPLALQVFPLPGSSDPVDSSTTPLLTMLLGILQLLKYFSLSTTTLSLSMLLLGILQPLKYFL